MRKKFIILYRKLNNNNNRSFGDEIVNSFYKKMKKKDISIINTSEHQTLAMSASCWAEGVFFWRDLVARDRTTDMV